MRRPALGFLATLLVLLAAPGARTAPDEPLWIVETTSDQKGSGQIADLDGDGRLEIVFGTYFGDAHLYAVNAEDGSVLWRHASERGPFDASVAVADLDGDGLVETLVADSATGRLEALAPDGEVRWTLKLPSGTDSPPAVGDLDGDGKPEVVVGTMWRRGGVGSVCAIDPREPGFRWTVDVKGCVQSEPALVDLDGDGKLDVVVTSWRGDRGVHAFRGTDGTALWSYFTAGQEKDVGMYHGVSVTGAGDALRLVVPTCAGLVYALDRTGRPVWARAHPGEYLFAPSTVADFDGDGSEDVFYGGRRAYCVRAADGALLWERALPASMDRGGAPVDLGGDGTQEVVLAAGTKVLVLDGRTGAVVFERDLARDPQDRYEDISSAPLVGDFDGDGRVDVFVVCGRGYSGDLQPQNFGRAIALPLGQGSGSWPTFRGGLGRTGRAGDR